MPTYRDEAVVLRTHKLGEADRIVTMLSRQHGKIRAVAKGVRRTSSKFGSRLEPFMVVDAQLYVGRSLDIIQQAESLGAYGAMIAGDYASFTAANAMVETADRLTDDDGSLQQYLLLVGALRSLSRREHGPGLTLDSYLLRALSIAGWAPSFGDCAVTGAPGPHSAFVVQMGGVVADAVAPPGAPRIDAATLDLLGALLSGDWVHAEQAPEATRAQASGIVAAYTQFHLERGLRSLQHVDRSAAAAAPRTTVAPAVLDRGADGAAPARSSHDASNPPGPGSASAGPAPASTQPTASDLAPSGSAAVASDPAAPIPGAR